MYDSLVTELNELRKAMEAIQNLISGETWDSDTVENIAQVMEQAGYPIQDI